MRKIVGEQVERRERRDGSNFVIGTYSVTVDELECGHRVDQVSRVASSAPPKTRRCPECKPSLDPGIEPERVERKRLTERERHRRAKTGAR